MARLDQEPEIIRLSEALGLAGTPDPVNSILEYCTRRVDGWVREVCGVANISELEQLVATRLGVTIEEIWDDSDLEALVKKYVSLGEIAFALIRADFDGETFGATYRRKYASPDSPDRYVAFIDCRGDKASRRFFTRWHELAHIITLPSELDAPVRRSTRDPTERLMDEIAGHLGFYKPLFTPAFGSVVTRRGRLCFDAIDEVRRNWFAEASFQSTLFACLRSTHSPVIYIEAAPAHKAENERAMRGGVQWLFDELKPQAQLRAVQVISNDAAVRAELFIPPNIRIPSVSVIHRLFVDRGIQSLVAEENLYDWEHSGGSRLGACAVTVEARGFGERVLALVQPT